MNGGSFMQILKDEVKNKIEQCALEEFYQRGYKEASMRRIAAEAGISLGNLYHYFDNKEALFKALMAPAYQKAQDLIRLSGGQGESLTVLRKIAGETLPKLLEMKKALVILMEKSGGTVYEDTKQALIEVTAERIIGEMGISQAFGRVLGAALVEGVLLILREVGEKSARDALMALFRFYFYNWQQRI
jgi:AcrR family transcriptional regulator